MATQEDMGSRNKSLGDFTEFKSKKELNKEHDAKIRAAISDIEMKDAHNHTCDSCGLRTDFIFSDRCCELCTRVVE